MTDMREDFRPVHWLEVRKAHTAGVLSDSGIKTIGELRQKSAEELLALPGFGLTALIDLYDAFRRWDAR